MPPKAAPLDKAARDNRAQQLNPNNPRHPGNVSTASHLRPRTRGAVLAAAGAAPASPLPRPFPSGSPTLTQAHPRCRSPTHRQAGNVAYQGKGTKADAGPPRQAAQPQRPALQAPGRQVAMARRGH
jgi:hypothetical protein